MKNLDLNACGVSEMNATEMMSVEGGITIFSLTGLFSGDPHLILFGWQVF